MLDKDMAMERIIDALTHSPMTAKQIAKRAFPENPLGGFLTKKVEAELYHMVAKGEVMLVGQNKFSLPSQK